MKFGIMFASVGAFASAEGAATIATAADEMGLESIWSVEHVVIPDGYQSRYPYNESGRLPLAEGADIPDPLIWLAYVAGVTRRIRLATGILIVPQRNPLILAKECASLDRLSGGRFELGIGVGWLAEEFAALGVPFAERGSRADEHLAALRALWADEVASFHGRHVDFTDAVSLPHPVQAPGPPILIGGDGDGPLRRVARYGDGWYPWNVTPAELEQGLLRLDEQLAAYAFVDGRTRSRDDVTIQVGLRFRRSLDELAELIAAYAALGASRVVIAVPISASAYETRLGEVAAALGVAPA